MRCEHIDWFKRKAFRETGSLVTQCSDGATHKIAQRNKYSKRLLSHVVCEKHKEVEKAVRI